MDFSELFDFLKLDSTSAKGKGKEAGKFLRDKLLELKADVMEIPENPNPYVIGKINVGGKRTLVVYNHYDVQPAEELDKWDSNPFDPVTKGDRIYARGVADDKGTLLARLQAVRDMIKEGTLRTNVIFFYEGEEEIGSPNMKKFLEKHAEVIKGDFLLWEGAGRASNNSPQIVLGVKGLLYVEIRFKTAKDLHSMYAPIADNPVWRMTSFLNELKKDEKVNLTGFYSKVRRISEEQKKSLLKLDKGKMEEALGQSIPNDFPVKLVEEPTCNIAGIFGGYTGQGSKTVIPSYCFVKMDFRLVPDMSPEEVLETLKPLAEKWGGEVVVYGMEEPFRTSPTSFFAKAVRESALRAYATEPVIWPNSPGTGPMAAVAKYTGITEIADGVGVDSYDSNIHSFNENIRKDDYQIIINQMKYLVKLLE
ncbi:acetylornithine deacetylase [Sulfolobales archaeon HS-7]|nr:acetylornithine deacetylase [Sulfolobales archaeon HS-7]